jgi:hypothetical protein
MWLAAEHARGLQLNMQRGLATDPDLEASDMYLWWAQHGLSDFIVIAVAVFPGDVTNLQLRVQEQLWMDAFGTLNPHGYNRRRAVALALMPHDLQLVVAGRFYGFNVMQRRVPALYRASTEAVGTVPRIKLRFEDLKSVLTHLGPYTTHTINRLHGFVLDCMAAMHPTPAAWKLWLPDLLAAQRQVLAARICRNYHKGARI